MNQWRYIVKDKFLGYISWEMFEQIQSLLQQNYSEYVKKETVGIPRSGKALATGLVYCGACGHKMRVQYDKEKNDARYICNTLMLQFGAPKCQNIPADPVDEFISAALNEAKPTKDCINPIMEISHEQREAFLDLGKKLPTIWSQISEEKKKAFLRAIIDKVVICRREICTLSMRIVWKGGDTTTKEVWIPTSHYKSLPNYPDLMSRVRPANLQNFLHELACKINACTLLSQAADREFCRFAGLTPLTPTKSQIYSAYTIFGIFSIS